MQLVCLTDRRVAVKVGGVCLLVRSATSVCGGADVPGKEGPAAGLGVGVLASTQLFVGTKQSMLFVYLCQHLWWRLLMIHIIILIVARYRSL